MTNGGKEAGKTDILIVDDNPADTALILSVLKKANIINRIHVLADGGEILEFLFRKGRYQDSPTLPAETLILLSLKQVGTSGLEVLRKIKSDERSRVFPVIVLASSQEDRGVMDSYKLGANACIVQPVEIGKFIEAVAELRLGWLLVASDERDRNGL
jgi:CheY-like chemotaxis protein